MSSLMRHLSLKYHFWSNQLHSLQLSKMTIPTSLIFIITAESCLRKILNRCILLSIKSFRKLRIPYIQGWCLYAIRRIVDFKQLEWFSSLSRLRPFLMNTTCTCNVEDKWHNYNLLQTYIHTTALRTTLQVCTFDT